MESSEAKQKHKSDLLVRLKRLQQEEEETKAMIQSVDVSLFELGLNFGSSSSLSGAVSKVQTGIQINGALSFRGKEKCTEYFKLIDSDHDGMLNFEDFRAMKAFQSTDRFSIVHDTENVTWDAWKMRMEDQGIATTKRGEVNLHNFIKYRALIERKQTLSRELDYLGLGFLPEKQLQWISLKTLVHEIYDFHDSLVIQRGDKPGPRTTESSLLLSDVSFVLGNLGLGYTKTEIAVMMWQRSRKAKVLEDVIRKYSKRCLSDAEFGFLLDTDLRLLVQTNDAVSGQVSIADIEHTPTSELIPWVFSHYRLLDPSDCYRQLISLKYRCLRSLRQVNAAFKVAHHFMLYMNDKLVFRDFLPLYKISTPAVTDLSSLKVGLSVGDEANREGGVSLSWKLIKIENPAQVLKVFGLPADAGSSLAFDFVLRDEATEERALRTASLFRSFLAVHVEKELRTNLQFISIQVFPTVNDNGDVRVIRVAISYKRLTSLENFLEQMLLPYKVYDLLTVWTGEVRTNFDLADLIAHKHDLSSTFAGTFEMQLTWRRTIIAMIMERVHLACKAILTPLQAAFDESEAEATVAKKKEEILKSQGPSIQVNKLVDKEEIAFRRLKRWKTVYPYFPFIGRLCSNIARALRIASTGVVKFRYTSIGEFFHFMGSRYYWFRNQYPEEMVYKLGYIKQQYEAISKRFKDEFNGLHSRLTAYLKRKKDIENAKRMNEFLDARKKEQSFGPMDEKEKTLETLRRLGVDTDDAFEDDPRDPISFMETVQEENNKHDILALSCLENFKNNVLGLHTIDFFNGSSRVAVNVGGVDFFHIIPSLQSMEESQQTHKIPPRKKAT